MKFFIAVLFFTSGIAHSLADCGGQGMDFWPKGGIVKENPIFMVEGYANDESIITALNSDYPIYLKSGDEIIQLVVQEICVGQFYLTQAILTPESKLTVGKTYELIIENSPDYLNPLRTWNSATEKYEPVTWNVISGEDKTVPTWTQKPRESKKTLVHYGCGPAIGVHYNFAVYDESPVLLKTTVTDLKSKVKTTYYLDATELSSIALGHGMCSGAFIFEKDSKEFTVTFDLVDGSGNLNLWTYDAISFTKPTELNSQQD